MSSKKRKKPTKRIDWKQTLIGALVDLAVGTLLILIDALIQHR